MPWQPILDPTYCEVYSSQRFAILSLLWIYFPLHAFPLPLNMPLRLLVNEANNFSLVTPCVKRACKIYLDPYLHGPLVGVKIPPRATPWNGARGLKGSL